MFRRFTTSTSPTTSSENKSKLEAITNKSRCLWNLMGLQSTARVRNRKKKSPVCDVQLGAIENWLPFSTCRAQRVDSINWALITRIRSSIISIIRILKTYISTRDRRWRWSPPPVSLCIDHWNAKQQLVTENLLCTHYSIGAFHPPSHPINHTEEDLVP